MKKIIMSILYSLAALSLSFILSTEIQNVVADSSANQIFLPLVMRSEGIPTPIPTQQPTPIPTQQPTPISTQQPPIISGNIQITTIFFDGVVSIDEPDEYVEIKNFDNRSIQVEGWTLRDIANHIFTFPNFVMAPNQVCRVYTNQNHPEFCSFNYGSSQAI